MSFYTKAQIGRVEESVDVKWLLEKHYEVENLQIVGDRIKCNCPLHNERNASFSIYYTGKYKGLFKCFGCDAKGNIFSFIRAKEKIGFKQAVKFLAKLFGVSNDYTDIFTLEKLEEEATDLMYYDDKHRNEIGLYFISLEHPIIPFRYLTKERNFTSDFADNLIKKYRIGVTNYVTTNGNIIKCIGFHLCNNGKKYSTFLQGLDYNIKRYAEGSIIGDNLFDISNINNSKRCILAEGIWDTLKIISFGFPCLTTFSCNITDKQAMLLASKFDEIYFAFDNDKNNAGENATKKAIELLGELVTCKRVLLPKKIKDPCVSTKPIFVKALRKAGWKS